MLDLIIRNADIVDGTGSPAFRGDLAVEGGIIREVGRVARDSASRVEVDAAALARSPQKPLLLCPGFVDIHSHADVALLARPQHLSKVMQGVTTEVFTNCGLGFAPATEDSLGIQRSYLRALFGDDTGVDWNWRTVGDLLNYYARQGTGVNIAYLVAHGPLRTAVMGMQARPATPIELEQMVSLLAEAMEAGAWGLSTGLWYAPMCHAGFEEVVSLARVAGWFATHQRDYGPRLFEATQETIAIAEHAGVPAQLSHLQLGGTQHRGRGPELVEQLDRARRSGVDVAWDTYPYGVGSTMISALLPAWAAEHGAEAALRHLADPDASSKIAEHINGLDRDWSSTWFLGLESEDAGTLEGVSFEQAAESAGCTVGEVVCRVLLSERMRACYAVNHTDEPDMIAFMQHPAHVFGSDGLHLPGKTHPRLHGAFPRVLARYVRELGVLGWEEAIHKMTGGPAQRLGLRDRGVLRVGLAADLCLVDRDEVRDTATFASPSTYPEGIPFVWVNGVAVKAGGQPTGALPGRVLRP
jgi:N-acyl-D-amino-acid deacylase